MFTLPARRSIVMAGERVLIVEDNEKSMKLFRDVLVATGYRTLEARTGAEALELATEQAPDLVLMDVQLPDIDGVEALRRLRADERTACDAGSRRDRAGHARRPGAVPGGRLRRLPLEAGRRRRAPRDGANALRAAVSGRRSTTHDV